LFIVEHYILTQRFEAVKQTYHVPFPDAAVPHSQKFFHLLNNGTTICSFCEYAEAGRVMSTTGPGEGTFSTHFENMQLYP
jgi:hypothetical protein